MKAIRLIFSVLMAILLLVSSTSFMVGMHLCMGEVQSIAIFSQADRCAMEQKLPPCHRHAVAPCCEDESVIHEADDFKIAAQQNQAAPPQVDMAPSLVLIAEIIPSSPSQWARHSDYDPPIRSSDLIVQHQVFLI